MARISLENMRFRANHGLYEEEQKIGNDFMLDISIDTDIQMAAVIQEHDTEKVINTVNYELVYEICRIEMNKPQKLLETVIEEIIYRLKRHFPNIEAIQINLRKLNPPLGGRIAAASIMEVRSFEIQCAKCGSVMICYGDSTCWCQQENARDRIHPRSLELINQEFKGSCLCRRCLKSYEG
ncbi:MAG: dihydroneopterin aldolase [Saprospiraceae bacterium]|nr:dihydroneopterin aldolase [Saprospiraceae bacterium]